MSEDIYKEFGVVTCDFEKVGPSSAEIRMAKAIADLRYRLKRMEDMKVDNIWKARSEVAFELARLKDENEHLRVAAESIHAMALDALKTLEVKP